MKIFNKARDKWTMGMISLLLANSSQAQYGMADPEATLNKTQSILTRAKAVLPLGFQVFGFFLAGVGIYTIIKHYKEQGRGQGGLAGGWASAIGGVVLFVLGSFMRWVASGLQLDMSGSNAMPG